MATISASWTENQSLQAAQELNVDASDTDDIDLDTNGYIAIAVQWKGTFASTAGAGCELEILSSPDSGTTDDTIALHSQEVSVDAGNTVAVSFVVRDVPYIAFKRRNKDSGWRIHDETVTYAGLQYTSA